MPKPAFTHDCDHCKFIGHLLDHDIYVCPQSGYPTIVARFGSDGPEYTSGRRLPLSPGVTLLGDELGLERLLG